MIRVYCSQSGTPITLREFKQRSRIIHIAAYNNTDIGLNRNNNGKKDRNMSNMDSNIRSSSQVRLRRESSVPRNLRKHDEGERLNAISPVNEVGDNKLPRYDPSRPASRSGPSQPDPPRVVSRAASRSGQLCYGTSKPDPPCPGPSRSISSSQAKTPGGKLTIKYIFRKIYSGTKKYFSRTASEYIIHYIIYFKKTFETNGVDGDIKNILGIPSKRTQNIYMFILNSYLGVPSSTTKQSTAVTPTVGSSRTRANKSRFKQNLAAPVPTSNDGSSKPSRNNPMNKSVVATYIPTGLESEQLPKLGSTVSEVNWRTILSKQKRVKKQC